MKLGYSHSCLKNYIFIETSWEKHTILRKLESLRVLFWRKKPQKNKQKLHSQPRLKERNSILNHETERKKFSFSSRNMRLKRKKFSFLSRKLKLASRHALEVQEKWCTLARSEFKNIYFHNVATWSRTFGNSCNGHILGQPNLALFANCINVGTFGLLLMVLLTWNFRNTFELLLLSDDFLNWYFSLIRLWREGVCFSVDLFWPFLD